MVISENENVKILLRCNEAQSQFCDCGWIGWPHVVLCRSMTNAWWWMKIDFSKKNNNTDAVRKPWMPKENNSVMSPTLILSLLILKHGSKSFNLWNFLNSSSLKKIVYLFRFKAIYFNILLLVPFCFEFDSSSVTWCFFIIFFRTRKNESF